MDRHRTKSHRWMIFLLSTSTSMTGCSSEAPGDSRSEIGAVPQAVVGSFTDESPSAVDTGDRLIVFSRSYGDTLTHRYYDRASGAWSAWIEVGPEKLSSMPSAVFARGRLTVFARGEAGNLVHRYYENGWTGWIPLGDEAIDSAPAAVVNENGARLIVFARGSSGNLVHKYYDWTTDAGWTSWLPLDSERIGHSPSAVVHGGRLVVFTTRYVPEHMGFGYHEVVHKYYPAAPGSWSDWIALGGHVNASLGCASTGQRLVVFARTLTGELTHRYYDVSSNAWSEWLPLDGTIASGPGAIMAQDRFTVFAIGSDKNMKYRYYDSVLTGWTGWIDLGGPLLAPDPIIH